MVGRHGWFKGCNKGQRNPIGRDEMDMAVKRERPRRSCCWGSKKKREFDRLTLPPFEIWAPEWIPGVLTSLRKQGCRKGGVQISEGSRELNPEEAKAWEKARRVERTPQVWARKCIL